MRKFKKDCDDEMKLMFSCIIKTQNSWDCSRSIESLNDCIFKNSTIQFKGVYVDLREKPKNDLKTAFLNYFKKETLYGEKKNVICKDEIYNAIKCLQNNNFNDCYIEKNKLQNCIAENKNYLYPDDWL